MNLSLCVSSCAAMSSTTRTATSASGSSLLAASSRRAAPYREPHPVAARFVTTAGAGARDARAAAGTLAACSSCSAQASRAPGRLRGYTSHAAASVSGKRHAWVHGGTLTANGVHGVALPRRSHWRGFGRCRSTHHGAEGSEGTAWPESTRVQTTARVVAIGDLHGDLHKAVQALRLAGVLEVTEQGLPEWIGGDTHLVQLGDIFDRGDKEIQILHLLLRLREQAQEVGGNVFMLNGNHETLNICGDFRYVTRGAFLESAIVAGLPEDLRGHFQAQLKARLALFQPGGPIAQELSKSFVALQINDTVFAHGGVLPHHVEYGLARMNEEMSRWMRGEKGIKPPIIAMGSPSSVLWCREYSREKWGSEHEQYRSSHLLSQTLGMLQANQMVVGHTPQEHGANAALDGRIWRIDVGMSSGVLGAEAAVLEITRPQNGATKSEVKVLNPSLDPRGQGKPKGSRDRASSSPVRNQ